MVDLLVARRRHRLGLACLALAALGGCLGRAVDEAGPRPSFLVLIADDQRWDQLSCAEHPLIPELRTPNLDRLALRGVYFENAFVPTPICAVSRASLMTGRYASSHGMNHFDTPLPPEVLAQTYPALLKAHGYRTGVLGKWGMGTAGAEEVFDVFDAWAGQGAYFHEIDGERVHNAEWLARRAREFLATCTPETPFCLTVCFKSPHHPYHPDERDARLFEDVVIPKRRTDTAEAYRAVASPVIEHSLNRWCYFDERGDEATKERFEKDFLRCVVSLDRAVGEIVRSLEDLGLDERTVVVYISDNGYLWGEHGLGGKWLPYEESIRVPLVIDGAGLPAAMRGRRSDELALSLDVAPTLLDLAGVPIPPEMDGVSLVPLREGSDEPLREDFFLEHVGVIEVEPPIPDTLGVRTKDWKYLRYVGSEPEVEELYRLVDDPWEANDLAGRSEHAELLRRLSRLCDEYRDSLGG